MEAALFAELFDMVDLTQLFSTADSEGGVHFRLSKWPHA